MRCDQTPAWQDLKAHAAQATGFDLRTAFAQDAHRAHTLSQTAPQVFADLSKNHVDAATEALLQALAQQTGLAAHHLHHLPAAISALSDFASVIAEVNSASKRSSRSIEVSQTLMPGG
jgi:hypothetical protein